MVVNNDKDENTNSNLNELLSLFNVGYKNDAINIIECGKEICLPKKPYFPSSRNYYTIHYVLHGKGKLYVSESNPVELKAGDFFIIMPNKTIKYLPVPSNPWVYTWVGASGTIIDKVIQLLPFNNNKPYIISDKDKTVQEYFDNIVESYNKNNFLHLKPLAYFELLLSYLVEKYVNASKLILSQKQMHIKEAQMFISCNYKQQLTVKDVADSLGLNSNYLSNIFNEILNISTKQFIVSYKMQKACEFLESGNYNVREVAGMVGYADSIHFSKEFKKINRVSPIKYKKMFQ